MADAMAPASEPPIGEDEGAQKRDCDRHSVRVVCGTAHVPLPCLQIDCGSHEGVANRDQFSIQFCFTGARAECNGGDTREIQAGHARKLQGHAGGMRHREHRVAR